MRLEEHLLPDGLRILQERGGNPEVVSIGLFLPVGSADEGGGEDGMAHLLEHLCFKGTARMNAAAISEAVDMMGGEINAQTEKESTLFYVRVPRQHAWEALDLLWEMVFSPLLATGDLERERNVVLEELRGSFDTPDDYIYDVLAEGLFGGHPLAHPILGSEERILAAREEDVVRFHARHYRSGRAVLVVIGELEPKRLLDEVTRLLVLYPSPRSVEGLRRPQPVRFGSGTRHEKRRLSQTHLLWGFPAVPLDHPEESRWGLLNGILGAGSSSRLFLRLREEEGLAYSVFSEISLHRDLGYLSIYAALPPDHQKRAVSLMEEELARLAEEGPSERELLRAKAEVRGGLTLGLEGGYSRMLFIGRQAILSGRVERPQEFLRRTDAVSGSEVHRLVQDMMEQGSFRVTLGPGKKQGVASRAQRGRPA